MLSLFSTTEKNASERNVKNCDSENGYGKNVEVWNLPTGAELITKNIAAERILHLMLDNKLGDPQKLESRAVQDLVMKFPGTCLR